MILQHLTSEVLKLPNAADECDAFEARAQAIPEPMTAEDLSELTIILNHKFDAETRLNTRVQLTVIETNMIKAKHFIGASEPEDDFV
ncbi:hypothetical protein D3C87_459850 [compost metagenome]